MSQKVVNTVVFAPGTAGNGTVTFTDFVKIDLNRIAIITNVTDGVFIFHFADPTLGGAVATNVLTLDADTNSMSSGDAIQVLYNYEEGVPDDRGNRCPKRYREKVCIESHLQNRDGVADSKARPHPGLLGTAGVTWFNRVGL